MSVSSSRPGLRVLLVDDNRDAADTLALLVELWGHEARVAYDAESALRMAAEAAPDCLISDIAMPRLNGYDLARRMRSKPSLAQTRLIALSSFSDLEHQQRSTEAGFEFILTKSDDPTDLRELLAMIEQIKELASQTKDLAKQNVDLVSETRDTLKEVKEDVKEVKQGVQELKQDVNHLKKEVGDLKSGQDEAAS